MSEIEIECPNGCQPDARRAGVLCLICYGTGWAPVSVVERVVAERAEREKEVTIGMKTKEDYLAEEGVPLWEWAEQNIDLTVTRRVWEFRDLRKAPYHTTP